MTNLLFNDYSIDKLSIEDLKEVTRLENEIFPNPWSEESIRYELTHRSNSFLYKVSHNDKIIAYTFSWIILDEMHIGNFAVIKGYRQQGIGKAFMNFIIEEGKRLGAEFYYLEVRKSNIPAISLYQKMGFRIVGIRKEYYSDNKEDAYLMSLTL